MVQHQKLQPSQLALNLWQSVLAHQYYWAQSAACTHHGVQQKQDQRRQCGMSELVLKIENLTKTYTLGKREVQPLTNLNLEIKKGEFTAIMGPSGSGKTTLLNIMGCIDKPTKGKVLLDNVDIGELPESQLYKIRRDKIGFIFQSSNLLPYLNARENVELAMELAGKFSGQRSERANELLATVGLSGRESHRPQRLSQGEQQR